MAVAPVAGIPTQARDLEAALGRSHALWERMRSGLQTEFGPLAETWSFSKTTQRWSPEGRGIRFEVRGREDADGAMRLVGIKMVT
jgi:hypothetical protein